MKLWYFADAWYFIALIDRHDRSFSAATRLDAVVDAAAGVLTHDYVLSEVLAHFSDDGPTARSGAAQLVRALFARGVVVAGDRALFTSGLELYERRRDKEYSLVDCISMALMRDRGITHVLTNDHHFRQEGFTVLSDAP